MDDYGTDPMVFPRVGRVRGAVARSTTWWGRAWVRSFEETVVSASDLVTARTLARSGRLGAVMVLAGMASVVVDRGDPGSVMAQLRVTRLEERAWQAFAAELAAEAGFTAALDSGELPVDLVEHADQTGVELLPGPGDLETACECDAWAQPCVHALALLYQLAWHLDSDPYALLLLRGRTREQLTAPPVSPAVLGDAAARAAAILRLAEEAPSGHGLADSAVAAYDEEISRLI
ncbi:putative Zn finger protein [Marmoricola sp. URHA0025 HA25]